MIKKYSTRKITIIFIFISFSSNKIEESYCKWKMLGNFSNLFSSNKEIKHLCNATTAAYAGEENNTHYDMALVTGIPPHIVNLVKCKYRSKKQGK